MTERAPDSKRTLAAGAVALVGAGPGDPELITLRALRLLKEADVVVYDRLASPALLSHARPDAELIDAGKAPGERRMRQEHINALLIDRARRGSRVARLKGGDPFIFGRGGEEASALSNAGIPFEVAPGVTSAIAAPAYAGIPLTHRGVSSSVTIATGSRAPSADGGGDWRSLAAAEGSLCLLMSWENLPQLSQALIEGGRSPDTPCAVVQWGTLPNQRTVVAPLSGIARIARDAGLGAPVVVVVGEVVNLRSAIRWFDNRPLFGKRVLVTRSRSQSARLLRLLRDAGAEPREVPLIEIQPLEDHAEIDAAVDALSGFDWVVFTSANGVERLFDRLRAQGLDARALGGVQAAAIGTATAEALLSRGVAADLVARESAAQSLVEALALAARGLSGRRVLLPGAETRPKRLTRGLERLGAVVESLPLYRNVMPENAREHLTAALAEGVDVVTFTSSSTATNLVTAIDGDASRLDGVAVACIGRVTAQTAIDAGLSVDAVAEESTAAGLVAAIVGLYTAKG